MWPVSIELSTLSQKTEVKQIGLDFPHAAQTKHMLWGSCVARFSSKKLVDQDRTVCTHVFIPHRLLSFPLAFFFFFFCFTFFPLPSSRQLKKSFATERLFAALHFSIWVSETFAHNLNTSTSTHTHTQSYQPMQTFLFLMWPTHLELQRHQPADRFNESCSHDQPVWSWCSHITLHKCCCVSDLFSFPLADCWGHMVSFSHPNYRYLVEGEKNTWNTPQCIASTDRIMQTLIFPCGIFF